MAASLAINSKKTYSSCEKRYIDFCQRLNIAPRSILPADENWLTFFSTYMARYVKTETIKVYLAAIRYMHIINGCNLDLQSFLRLQYVLKGIKRTQGQSKRVRLPITLTHLKLFQLLFSSPSTHNEMLWAALKLAFFGFLRVSEFTCPGTFNPKLHLSCKDITFFSPQGKPKYMKVNLKVSKTDSFRTGVTLITGCLRTEICPVSAMLKYISHKSSTDADGPLFQLESSAPLTRNKFTSLMRDLLATVGINPKHYASHSFHICAATSAGAVNMPPWLIKTLGRWTSDCYERYIKISPSTLCSATQQLTSCLMQPLP